MRSVIFLVCVLTATSTSLFAHADRIIALEGTSLTGLPPTFSPAHLNTKDGTLVIGTREMLFTPYLRAFFPEDIPYAIHVSASWYHEQSQLPPYILIRVYPNKKEDLSYGLLFNLETLDLLSVTIAVQISPKLIREFPIAVTADQKLEIRNSISKLRDKLSR